MDSSAYEATVLESTAGLRQLDTARVIEVTGEDAREWLSGMVTNDLSPLKPGHGIYTLVLNSKGKILSDAWVSLHHDTPRLTVPESVLEALMAHFDKYIIMEDVEVETLAARVFSIQGPQATLRPEASTGLLGAYTADRLGHGGIDLLMPQDIDTSTQISEISEAYEAKRISVASWELARVRARRPAFGQDFNQNNYAQEARLQMRAVSFNKGCYLGQEVVCMMENRGRPRQMLFALEGLQAQPEQTALSKDEKPIGHITSWVFDPESARHRGIGMLKSKFATPELDVQGAESIVRVVNEIPTGS